MLIALMLGWGGAVAHAQGGGLLQNGSFDGAYTGRGGIAGGVPDGWNVWGNFQDSDHESLGVLLRSLPYSWRLRAEHAQPTGGGYQSVAAQRGTTYRFSAYAMIWTCDDEQWQCRDETHTFADPSSGGRVRVGIDPAGGTDPFSGSVRWSGFASPFDWGSFAPLSVEAAAAGSQITVFTYFTSDRPMRFNDVFWEDASLVATGTSSGGTGQTGGSGNPGSSAPPATAAPVVASAQTRPDGSQVHIVQAGQTLWGIAQAYGVSVDTLRALNNLSGSTIYVGQPLIVRAASAAPTAPPTATGAALFTASPPPTLAVVQGPPITPVAVAVTRDDEPSDHTNNGPRTAVLVLAVAVLLVAVTITGGLAGYVAYKVFRAS